MGEDYTRRSRLCLPQPVQALTELAPVPGRPVQPVLFLLDEFAALNHLEPVERSMGLMAGYGIQLLLIVQDIHQPRALYGQCAGTFLSNAGVLQMFGVNDHQSAQLVSDLLSQETVAFDTISRALGRRGKRDIVQSAEYRPPAADPRRGPNAKIRPPNSLPRRAAAGHCHKTALLYRSRVLRAV